MSDDSNFSTRITKTVSEKGVEYIEILIKDKYQEVEITLRAYPQNVFVAIYDNTDIPFGGQDLNDCYIAPPNVIEKTPKEQFDSKKALLKACEELWGKYDWTDVWNEVKFDIQRWMSMWSKTCLHLRVNKQTRLYAMETRYEPAEYEVRLTCRDCGEELDSVSEDAEVRDE